MNANKNILVSINQARYIACKCNVEIQQLRDKRRNIKPSNNLNTFIKNEAKKEAIDRRIALLEDRALRVWQAVTSFQGKYINWKNLHVIDGVEYCGILQLIDASLTHPSFTNYKLN